MFFEKTFRVMKEISKRKNATKERIKAQQKELKDKLPFDATVTQTLKIGDMLLNKIPDIECFTVVTDENSEAIIDDKMQEELTDYIIKKHEENGCLYDIKFREIEI